MKKLSKIKLNQLNKSLMDKRELINLLGGGYGAGTCCGCGCHYYGQGGSSSFGNGSANFNEGYYSPGGQKGCWTGGGPVVLPDCN
jgi:natural product precursor